MDQSLKTRFGNACRRAVKKTTRMVIFLLCFSPVLKGFGQQTNKIQQAVDAIKAANNNEEDDYVTDGQRTVWVKSYKKWEPKDLLVMKNEDPGTLRFLGMAAQHARYDVLGQLLPDYYRTHGGVKAFAADVLREQETTVNPAGKG